MHRLLTELVPGGAPRHLSVPQAKALLATVRPPDAAGRLRRQLAAELTTEIEDLTGKLKLLARRLRQEVTATGSGLLNILGDRPGRRRPDPGRRRRHRPLRRPQPVRLPTGTAPLDASSGEQIRHRLSRAGNRRLNHVLYIAALAQIRHNTPGRAYYRRKLAEGKTPLEALRCLRRRLSDVVYRQLVTDATAPATALDQAGPGGHSGATTNSSATGPTPTTGSSDKPQPGPAPATLPRTTPASPAAADRAGAPEASTWSAPPDERR